MNRKEAKNLVIQTFENKFNKESFIRFIANLFKEYDRSKALEPRIGIQGITEKYLDFVSLWERIGRYKDSEGNIIDILIVKLKKEISLLRARSAQRNFVADYLRGKLGTTSLKDAALVAFISPDEEDWRFSLVKMDYKFEKTDTERVEIKEEFTPAKRWSFLVGPNEKSHTAQSRFTPLLEKKEPLLLRELEEAFNIEVVTEEFFRKYRDLFIKTKIELDKIVKENEKVRNEFQRKNITPIDFAKKLLGQIVFLYFLQKKGWFGVEKGKPWGTGPKDFIRKLFNKEYGDYQNFYNDILEPLFYEALRTDRSADDHYYSRFNCKIPFLNGGLFDPPNNFDWVNIDLPLPNELFSNSNKTPEGDKGDGILDIFDRYNFTVNEEEPLEKEVALDPELLGKIYEKLNAIREDNFDEYIQVLKSGKKSDETKFNKDYGVYYTPRVIVHYMCQESLISYLETELNGKVKREDIERFVNLADNYLEYEKIAVQKNEKIKNGEQKETKYEHKIPKSIIEKAKEIDNLLANIKVCDPAVGSGAFLVGMLHEIVKLRQLLSVYLGNEVSIYDLKRKTIENSLYGVDIDPGAVEICKLRLWLSLVVDEDNFYNIKPLPNLDYKVVKGNSLVGFPENWKSDISLRIEELENKLFSETHPGRKNQIKEELDDLILKRLKNSEKNFGYKIDFDFRLFFPRVFKDKGGFDVVIGNPPYVSTKGVDTEFKKVLEKIYGFSDDLYNHFYFKGIKILREKGILAFISSKTFWTIQTKKNLRELILDKKLLQLVDTANPFESAMVDTCITFVQKTKAKDYEILFIDARNGLDKKEVYKVKDEVYENVANNVFFIPTEFNLKIYEKLGKKVKELLDRWWDKISSSKNIEKYKKELEAYRNSLKAGDITLLGLITEGGVGLQTGNNGKYIGVLEGTKWAEKVRKERPEKLWNFIKTQKPKELSNLKSKKDVEEYLNSLSEKEIRNLFDGLKEKYGRDIFGQGWLYRIVSKDEIADVESLSDDEKLNGISGDKTFVPYDKGDRDGNRWWAPTPYYIDWSRENVRVLQTDPKARWQGYQFYFKEGFCWKDIGMDTLKVKLKEKTINDVKSMSLYPTDKRYTKYLIAVLNSTFLSHYQFNFINNTVSIQINDIRQLPIIIPTDSELKEFEDIFNRAVNIQKNKFSQLISEEEAEKQLEEIQKELDEKVLKLYGLE
jgi:tRNA1(Val) A37 N6-methylase TrmN6